MIYSKTQKDKRMVELERCHIQTSYCGWNTAKPISTHISLPYPHPSPCPLSSGLHTSEHRPSFPYYTSCVFPGLFANWPLVSLFQSSVLTDVTPGLTFLCDFNKDGLN